MGRLPEALGAFEEAYSVSCEWTGPADKELQGIAIGIADLLRETGDFERAEYFSRVTYEITKEHHSAAAEVLHTDSAAGSRCQILTDAVREKSHIFPNTSEYDILKDAEALAREALAEAEVENKHLDEALTRLLDVFIEREKLESREVYLIALRLIRIRQSVAPPTKSSRLALASGYDVFASVLRKKLFHGIVGGGRRNVRGAQVAAKDTGEARKAITLPTVSESSDVINDLEAEESGEGKCQDEWSPIYMMMRLFYCRLSAVTTCAIEGEPSAELSLCLLQLNNATLYIVDILIILGRLDFSGDVAEWKCTNWEALIEECKHKVDYAEWPDVVEGNGDYAGPTTVAIEDNNKSESVIDGGDNDKKAIGLASTVGLRYSTENNTSSSTTAAVPVTSALEVAQQGEYEVQLGFAYWTLCNSLWRIVKSDVNWTEEGKIVAEPAAIATDDGRDEGCCKETEAMPQRKESDTREENKVQTQVQYTPTININHITALKEAERALKLASSYFEGETLFIASETAERYLKELADRLEEVSKQRTYLEGLID